MTEKPKRLTISKRDQDSTVGAELLSLCQSITTDGMLHPDEIRQLRDWLDHNRASAIPAVEYLLPLIERILADGIVTQDEQRELFLTIERILPPDVRGLSRTARRNVEKQEQGRDRPIDRFDFLVAGTGYEGRAENIKRFCNEADRVVLSRDYDNRFSRNAVRINTVDGHEIGFVPEDHAADLATLLDGSHPYRARIKKLFDGRYNIIPVVIAEIYRRDAQVADLYVASPYVARTASPASGFSQSLHNVVSPLFGIGVLVFVFIMLTRCFG